MAELSLTKFAAWQDENRQLQEAQSWINHIGKTGRSTRDHTDVLRMYPGHCASPKFMLAGQYTEGGKNYWESPKVFNEAMMVVILRHFKELSVEAMAHMEKTTADALVMADGEIEAIRAAITEAKSAA